MHPHGKSEETAATRAIRLHRNVSICSLENLLDYGETEADPFSVDLGRVLQPSKHSEELWDVFLSDTCASVRNVHHNFADAFIVTRFNRYGAPLSELNGILDKVDQNLLQTTLITV